MLTFISPVVSFDGQLTPPTLLPSSSDTALSQTTASLSQRLSGTVCCLAEVRKSGRNFKLYFGDFHRRRCTEIPVFT